MSEVEPRVQTADDAKASIISSIGTILQSISVAHQHLTGLFGKAEVKKDTAISRALGEIRKQLFELTDYLKNKIEGEQLYQRAQSILKLFSELDVTVRAIHLTLRAETAVVIMNAESREIIALEPKTERPKRFSANFSGWSADGMREELAVEFQLRFPIFLGSRITTSTSWKYFTIHIEHPLESPIKIKEVLKTLKQKAEQYLEKELLNAPLTFMYEVKAHVDTESNNQPVIDCLVDRPDDSTSLWL